MFYDTFPHLVLLRVMLSTVQIVCLSTCVSVSNTHRFVGKETFFSCLFLHERFFLLSFFFFLPTLSKHNCPCIWVCVSLPLPPCVWVFVYCYFLLISIANYSFTQASRGEQKRVYSKNKRNVTERSDTGLCV